MALMGGGKMNVIGGANVITLSDTAGADRLRVKDADGFEVFSVDSKGNLRLKGGVMRV